MLYLAFDLEFDALLIEGDVPHVIAAATFEGNSLEKLCPVILMSKARLWKSREDSAHFLTSEIDMLIQYMVQRTRDGTKIVSWGGTSGDFRVLHALCSEVLKPQVISLCKEHIDIPFSSLCESGCFMGLDAATRALGLPGKGSLSKSVPELWSAGARDAIYTLVKGDAAHTALVFTTFCSTGVLTWMSKRGSLVVWTPCSLAAGASVRESLALPEPQTKWKTNLLSLTRQKIIHWME